MKFTTKKGVQVQTAACGSLHHALARYIPFAASLAANGQEWDSYLLAYLLFGIGG
jgi:hypothetical protein